MNINDIRSGATAFRTCNSRKKPGLLANGRKYADNGTINCNAPIAFLNGAGEESA